MAEQINLGELFQLIISTKGNMFASSCGADQMYRIGDIRFMEEIHDDNIEIKVLQHITPRGIFNGIDERKIDFACRSKYRHQVVASLEKYKRDMRLKHSVMQMKSVPSHTAPACIDERHFFISDKYRIVYNKIIEGNSFYIPKLTVSSVHGGENVDFTGTNAMKIAQVCEKGMRR